MAADQLAMNRIGNWLGLDGTGRRFYPLDPRPEEVTIEDIAHALSNKCRWGGRCIEMYPIAQHCVHVAQIVERTRPELALHALLHDAAEAYIEDLPTPWKAHLWVLREGVMEPIRTTEARILRAVFAKFEVPTGYCDPYAVKAADALSLATEARDLMGGLTWPGMVATNEPTIEPQSPRAARTQFLGMFRRLAANLQMS